MRESPSNIIVNSYARRFTIGQLDDAIQQISEVLLTTPFQSVSVLGSTAATDKDAAIQILETLERARQLKLEQDESTGEAARNIALDAAPAMSTQIDFSRRQVD